ncbi:MAG TPA: phosphoglucosamine mutase [Clostridiales bacterium]|jgi:phosphoglucosamine mutase|nr:phosphoglucosamine mutase [Clostridiales bacterium]
MKKLFGTDGVRGLANGLLTPELALKLGMCGAYVLTSEVHKPRIIVASDTRKSKDMLACALIAGICSVGGDVLYAGVIPTPALPFLTRKYCADAAVMISASHNPMQDNGIKWFNNAGFKLSDELEAEIEALMALDHPFERPTGENIGKITELKRSKADYIEFLCSTCEYDLNGMRIALDCANGAASYVAPKVFKKLNAQVSVCNNKPNGCNINRACGSTNIENLQRFVQECEADIGFAFDGDADRVIACDEHGNIVDGDKIMGLCAIALSKAGRLAKNTLVCTVMSNIGLKLKLKELGINTVETSVGDRYVLEEMRLNGYNLGGEQSGHIIFSDYNTTGDGLLSAIQVLNVVKAENKPLSELAEDIPIYPQILLNVEVDANSKKAAMNDAEMQKRIQKTEAELKGSGRVLVRESGTEPLIRIMLEGVDINDIRNRALYIAEPLVNAHNGKIR